MSGTNVFRIGDTFKKSKLTWVEVYGVRRKITTGDLENIEQQNETA